MTLTLTPIGTIHSPYTTLAGMPIQPAGAKGVAGTVELLPELTPGLADLDGFSHLILIYWFHQSNGYALSVTPFLDKAPRGLFATRAPKRPNAVGLSVVRLSGVRGNVLDLLDVDVLDGTPLLDVKPYVPAFDAHPEARAGWLEGRTAGLARTRSDGRFCPPEGAGKA